MAKNVANRVRFAQSAIVRKMLKLKWKTISYVQENQNKNKIERMEILEGQEMIWAGNIASMPDIRWT